MTFSFEIPTSDPNLPPFTEACPRCGAGGCLVPYATTTGPDDTLTGFYRHRSCGHQWTTRWNAKWSHTWHR